jgi:uncharacterized OB-fold protein
VELDQGPRLSSELVGVDPAALRVGMPVKPVFEDHPGAGVTLLKFTAA